MKSRFRSPAPAQLIRKRALLRNPYLPPQNSVLSNQPLRQETEIGRRSLDFVVLPPHSWLGSTSTVGRSSSNQPLRRETEMSYLEPLFFKNKNKEFGFNDQALFLCQLVLMKYRDKIL